MVRWRTPGWARAAVVCTALVVGMGTGLTQAGAANPPVPGLPEFYQGTTWAPRDKPISSSSQLQLPSTLGAITGTETELPRVGVAFRLPDALVAVNQVTTQIFKVPPEVRTRAQTQFDFPSLVYVQSPEGDPQAFGNLPSFRETTLAFGMIPVSVTTHLSQQRDANGYPIPFRARVDSKFENFGTVQEAYDVELSGGVTVRLDDLTIDGRKLDVGDSCQTVTPAQLSLVGKQPLITEQMRKPEFYSPPYGGDLYGTLDVPAFAGCRTPTGEDLSPILTNALSGEGNPVHINQGKPGQNGADDTSKGIGCTTERTPDQGEDTLCKAPDNLDPITGLGQVRDTPPDWTPAPSPFPLINLLPNPPAAPAK